MSIKYASAAAALISILSALAAQAQDRLATVQYLYTECTTNPTGVCALYITAVAETMWPNGHILSTLPTDTSVTVKRAVAAGAICFAGKVPAAAAVQAFKNWAGPNPQFWGDSRFDGVVMALRSTRPCPVP